jgi:hypothetical protein
MSLHKFTKLSQVWFFRFRCGKKKSFDGDNSWRTIAYQVVL